MKKCYPTDGATIGGRVRNARLASGYTIKDFAALIEVSANHLGLIERGEKQASFKLLQKIAKITETPYQQIIKGDPQKEADTPIPVDTTEKINLRLFLGLILVMTPSFSKENLAVLLNTSPDIIDSILNGEDVEWDPQWPSQLSSLAGLLGDITAIRRDLQNLDQFLADVELNRGMNILKENLIRYIYDEYKMKYKLLHPISHRPQRYSFNKNHRGIEFEVTCTTIVLYNVENPKSVWQFQLLQTQDTLDKEGMEEIFNSAADMAESLESTNSRLTMLFISEDNYTAFSDAAYRAMNRVNDYDVGPAELGEPSSVNPDYELINLFYAQVDSETWKIAEQKWDAVNTPPNHKMVD